jgi:hypothetical protein
VNALGNDKTEVSLAPGQTTDTDAKVFPGTGLPEHATGGEKV